MGKYGKKGGHRKPSYSKGGKPRVKTYSKVRTPRGGIRL